MRFQLRVLFSSFLLLFFCVQTSVFAQTFNGKLLPVTNAALSGVLQKWEVYELAIEQLHAQVKTSPDFHPELSLQLGFHYWDLRMEPSGILASDYALQVETEKGIKTVYPTYPKAFKGYNFAGNGRVRLTIDEGFIQGFVFEGAEKFYIEPLRYYDPAAAVNQFVVYNAKDVIHDSGASCTVIEEGQQMQELLDDIRKEEAEHKKAEGAESMACYQLEIAIASDKSMFNKYGSVAAVENHNISVLNDVQGDYTGNFNHDIVFIIVTQFVVTGTDPWSNSNDAATLLGSFRTWGNNGGFGVPFDNGSLWTNRDFTGGTIGIAYLNGICNSNKYHCLQDFSSNSELLRCLQSHELGHNFSLTHDGGSCNPPFIMCPFVSTSITWSAQSQNQFNNYVTGLINSGCLTLCQPAAQADFTFSPDPGCQGVPVQFTDQSSGPVTNRLWTFQNGSPATSTATNPTCTWNTAGTYNVTLTVNGNSSKTKSVTINPQPVASFTFTVSGTTVTFTNNSVHATSYVWDFGDGNASFDVNPVHTYAVAGIYTVTLIASNDCGTSTSVKLVNTAPSADFSATPTSGCATLFVNFTNESSSNATSFIWQFPGGNPSNSTAVNPIVSYPSAGTFSVTLTAINNVGNSVITKTNYITVNNIPFTNFTYTVNGLTVTFTNTTNGGVSYLWNFGDGNTSTQTNPVHTYATGGTYTVTLSATNICGTTVQTKTVQVIAPPTASFSAAPSSGCAPLTVTFTNSSVGASTYSWAFPGGTPATSTDTNVVVTYPNPGSYTATLTATNVSGSSTATSTVNVVPGPTAGFTHVTNNFTANFTNTSSQASTYLWNFGDGTLSTDTNAVHTYANDGIYLVRLISTGPCGVDTFETNVTIVTVPVGSFSGTPLSGCVPLTAQYNYTGTNNATAFSWTFPGGSPATATVANPVVVYTAVGTYGATLVVSNAAGSDTVSITNYITVGTTPTIGFTSSANGNTVTFTNTSSNATSYQWTFGDGNSSNAVNPVHTYANDGTYTVVLTATNACGTVTTTSTITTLTPPTANFNATPLTGCVPQTVQFNNTSSANSGSYAWNFPGGNPATSTAVNPVVVYENPGVYSVTLIVSNGAGSDTLALINYLTIGTTPTVGFSSAVSGLTVTFTNSSSGATSYLWSFGDGNSSTESNPVHTYLSEGSFTVVLTATNACGNSSVTQVSTVVGPPTASFSAPQTTGCAPFQVTFVNTSSSNSTSFLWQFAGGTPATSTEQTPTVVYETPGVYSVSLTATNASGSSSSTQNNYITVLGAPNAGFTSTANGSTVNFTNTSTGGTAYAWNFGDGGSSTAFEPTHVYADGTYTAVLTVTNDCGTSTFTAQIVVATPPTAAFNASTNSGCAPLTVVFNNTSSANATTFNWSFPGGTPASSTEINPTVVYAQAGVFTATLTATNAQGSSTTNTTITVGAQPAPSFTFLVAGNTVTFTNTSNNAVSYFWEFGDGQVSNATNPVHTYSGSGTYNVLLTASNPCGAVKFTQTIVLAGEVPVAAFSGTPTSGCAPLTVAFTDQSTGGPTNWAWTFLGGNPPSSNIQNPTVTYAVPGTYPVSLTVGNAFGNNSTTFSNYIAVGGLPAAAFNFSTNGGVVTFSNVSFNGLSFTWNFGDGNSSNEASPVHVYTQSGTYTVSLTATNPCGASTLTQVITVVITGVETGNWLELLRVFPNPNDGNFQVEMKGYGSDEVEFTLFNSLGGQIQRDVADFSSGSLLHTFRNGNLPAAVYTLRVRSGNQISNIKMVIQ